MNPKRCLRAGVAVLAAVAAVVLAPGTPARAGEPLKKVTLRLAFTYNGHRSPYLMGQQK